MSVVPDLLRLKEIPSNLEQNIETDLLEPSTFQEATPTTTGFVRFDLQKKGWLHSHSKLFVSLSPNDNQPMSIVPPSVGIGSVIERAVLKVGNAVLNEISDWSHLHQVKSAQINNETQIAREQYTTGRCMGMEYIYRKLADADAATRFVRRTDQSKTDAFTYGMSNGRDYDYDGNAATQQQEGSNLLPQPFSQIQAALPTESPVYSIDLSDLFPFLATHSLPLYMIDQQMSIELHWSPTLDRRVILNEARHAGAEGGVYKIDRKELKFCADYIFYTDSDLMARYAAENPRIEFAFPDYRLSKQTVSSGDLGIGIVSNLGMANRLCSRVITMVNPNESPGNTFDLDIQGAYVSRCPPRELAAPSANDYSPAVEYNIRYNDRFEFPVSIKNKARLFSHFAQSEGVLFVTRDQYSEDGDAGFTPFEFMGSLAIDRSQNSGNNGLRGRQYYIGTRLTNGRVGVRGIELHYKAAGMPNLASGYTLRSYIEYSRLAQLENGLFTIMNA